MSKRSKIARGIIGAAGLIIAGLTLSGFTRDGEAYLCSSQSYSYDAVAQFNLLTGALKGYEATDQNGLTFTIGAENSQGFDCISAAEIEEAQRNQWEECRPKLAASKPTASDPTQSGYDAMFEAARYEAQCGEALQ